MKVLYLAPLLPSLGGNGGKRAIYSHLEELLGGDADIDAVFVDVEGSGDPIPSALQRIRHRIFTRAMPSAKKGLRGKISGIWQMVSSGMPRSMAVVASPAACAAIREQLDSGNYDAVIIDHLNAYGLISGVQSTPGLLYVAHNVETEVLRQHARVFSLLSLMHWVTRWDASRMLRYESRLLARAHAIAVIGAGDLSSPLLKPFAGKTVLWPELPRVKEHRWRFNGNKQMLFVGSAQYFPNRDAIEWLVGKLMPAFSALDPMISLVIVGTRYEEMGLASIPPSVRFDGFVSNEQLEQLHLQSDLLVCPVILGAGIKIKVLEAASYGVPVAATSISLKGIDFLQNSALLLDRTDPRATAHTISRLLNDSAGLKTMSNTSVEKLTKALATRASLLNLLP